MLLEGKKKKKQEDLEKIKIKRKKSCFMDFFYHKFHIFHK